jgi:hypothetical protein
VKIAALPIPANIHRSYWHSGLPGILRKRGTYQASPARVSFLVGSCNHPSYSAFLAGRRHSASSVNFIYIILYYLIDGSIPLTERIKVLRSFQGLEA